MRTHILLRLAIAGATWSFLATAAQAQVSCPPAETPFFDSGTQGLICVGNGTLCAEGEEPALDPASMAIVCLPARDAGAPPQDQPLCPAGMAALRHGQALRCVDARYAASLACQPPYRVFDTAGACQWSCGAGTVPDEARGECVCQVGTAEYGTDAFGRRVCQADPRMQVPAQELDPERIPQEGERPDLLQ